MGEVVQFIPRPNPDRDDGNLLSYDDQFGREDAQLNWTVKFRRPKIDEPKESA